MGISLQLFEDSGPVVNGRGTYRNAVGNIGWKSDGTDETGNEYAFSPVTRPASPDELWARSYKKYNFAKISGSYPAASRIRIDISNGITGTPPEDYETETDTVADTALQQLRIFYKLSNVYEEPNDEWDGELRFVEGSVTLYPSTSLTGPEGVQSYVQHMTADTTYYTQYLITQLVVPYSLNAGNIGEVNIEWYIDEYEDGDL